MKKITCICLLYLMLPFSQANAVNPKDNRLATMDDPLQSVFTVKDKQKIKSAIVSGAVARGWRVVAQTEGRTAVTTTVRGKHVINLIIDYDDSSYQFHYLDSVNLLYLENGNKRLIHHNYNAWIRELATAINSFVGMPAVIATGHAVKHQRAVSSVSNNTTVIESSMPAPKASGYAAIDNIEAVPVRTEGKARYQHYLTLKSPKAFAVSDKGGWRFVWGNADASRKVLTACEEKQMKCWLYAVDDQVVWNADPEKRIGNTVPANP